MVYKTRCFELLSVETEIDNTPDNSPTSLYLQDESYYSTFTDFPDVPQILHLKRFTYRELNEATDSFSESSKIAEGEYGPIYKAVYEEPQINVDLVVKRLKERLVTAQFRVSSPMLLVLWLIEIRHGIWIQFTRDNNCTVEFDAFGFSVKDFLTRRILLRCDSSGDLYPVTSSSPTPHALLSVSPGTWHQRFGHPGEELNAYTDVDWAGCLVTRRAEAEYRGVANVVTETAWIRNLLRELHNPLFTATIVYCDNVSAVYMSTNLVQHQRTKHIEIDIHFVRDMVARGQVRVLHVPPRYQYANIFTKGLPTALFEEFRTSLSVRSSPAQTAEIIFQVFKSSNIFFDNQWNAKISYFDLAWSSFGEDLADVFTKMVETIGYAAPECSRGRCLTPMCDTWSYGVFLYELITGRAPLDMNRPQNKQKLLEWVKPHVDSDRFELITDPRLKGNYPPKEVHMLSIIANKCLAKNPNSRPKMSKVLEMVNKIIVPSQANCPAPPLKSLAPTRESKIDTGKAVDDDLAVTKSSGIESKVQDDNNRSGNDTDADDADIRPIYDEEPMAEYPEQCQVKIPMLDSSPDNQTTDYSKQSLESENILLKKIVA
nr:probable receptor-like protein kinase At5g47070 [Tanacetum cinerariifolium]